MLCSEPTLHLARAINSGTMSAGKQQKNYLQAHSGHGGDPRSTSPSAAPPSTGGKSAPSSAPHSASPSPSASRSASRSATPIPRAPSPSPAGRPDGVIKRSAPAAAAAAAAAAPLTPAVLPAAPPPRGGSLLGALFRLALLCSVLGLALVGWWLYPPLRKAWLNKRAPDHPSEREFTLGPSGGCVFLPKALLACF